MIMKKSELFECLLNLVSEEMEVPAEEITGKSKRIEVVDARSVLIKLLRERSLYPDQIAKLMNKTTACIRSLLNNYESRKHENKFLEICMKQVQCKFKTD